MADWQEGMAYLFGEQARQRANRPTAIQQARDQWESMSLDERKAFLRQRLRRAPNAVIDQMATQSFEEAFGGQTFPIERGGIGVEIGLPFGDQGPSIAPTLSPGARPSLPFQTSPGILPPSTRDLSMGRMRGAGGMVPGGVVDPFNPTPPAVRFGGFEEPEPGTPTPGVPSTGQPRRGGIGGFISENQELIGSVLGTAADVYGAHQEGKGREAELEERRRQHEAEMEERRKQREQDRIRMAMQGIAAFA